MDKQTFVFTLFDNNGGLTLDQIQRIDNNLLSIVPDGTIEAIIEHGDISREEAEEEARKDARQVFIDNLNDQPDLLALRDYLDTWDIKASDKQVFDLWYIKF